MDNPLASVLPYIIAILHGKPLQSAAVDDMCRQIEACAQMDEAMMALIRSFDTPKEAVQYGIELGMDMGLLAQSNGILRIPIKLAKRSPGDEPPCNVEVEYVDLRSSVQQRELPCNNEESLCNAADKEPLFSDERGESCYSIEEPLIPGQVLRSAMKRLPGTTNH
ncbi:uncharacterized protein LOC108151634 [Drosophila miranda]|uniref:uncharacterized protein LOC108151634 n=1 Tax=Drosophila miranda TaxID=7229 RepID=UPI0007E8699D|nr:uncharacterized protein LOC108151634 [Drosophila miranda]